MTYVLMAEPRLAFNETTGLSILVRLLAFMHIMCASEIASAHVIIAPSYRVKRT